MPGRSIFAKSKIILEIAANISDGISENTVCTVTESSHTLKFTSHGLEDH
jgi:hypothetical protein